MDNDIDVKNTEKGVERRRKAAHTPLKTMCRS
jgi:hypothetical protein